MIIIVDNFAFHSHQFRGTGLVRLDDRTKEEKRRTPEYQGMKPLFIQLFISLTDTETRCMYFSSDKGEQELIDSFVSLLRDLDASESTDDLEERHSDDYFVDLRSRLTRRFSAGAGNVVPVNES